MARFDAMRACRTHLGRKRYLDTQRFWQLSPIDRIEAYLWMVWPRAVHWNKLLNICKAVSAGHGGAGLQFQRSGRIIKLPGNKLSPWRFKPQ